ncbi:hypothetical protein F4556_006830 [Kitasatospora gansuensis]|uniref:Uncharacterized protein n=1 Tax=Kitasatospora gansuensis TaxID=258050 RepID=A0A7W7SIV6_9ACTN|nr:hypothetical protein [Kitasatospora gansuensis]MBB4951295.1 hypothetical protein [Kitasatospora gansuensis]
MIPYVPARRFGCPRTDLCPEDLWPLSAWQGELTNTEPDKHLDVVWIDSAGLPTPMFATSHAALAAYLGGGRGFSTHGWDRAADPRGLVGA